MVQDDGVMLNDFQENIGATPTQPKSSKRVRTVSTSNDFDKRRHTSLTDDFSNFKIVKRQLSRLVERKVIRKKLLGKCKQVLEYSCDFFAGNRHKFSLQN